MSGVGQERALEIAQRVEAFVREQIIPYEADERRDHHGAPTDELVIEMRAKAKAAKDAEVRLVKADATNFKVTFPADLRLAELVLQGRES